MITFTKNGHKPFLYFPFSGFYGSHLFLNGVDPLIEFLFLYFLSGNMWTLQYSSMSIFVLVSQVVFFTFFSQLD